MNTRFIKVKNASASSKDSAPASRARLGTAARIFLLLIAVAATVVVGFVILVSTTISQHMRAASEDELRRDVTSLNEMLAYEAYYMRAEAQTLAGLVGVGDDLQLTDDSRAASLAAIVGETHELGASYVITGDGEVTEGSPAGGLELNSAASQQLVQQAWEGQMLSRFIVADNRLWLAGAAPRVGPDGRIEAVVLVARELDHAYVNRLSEALGSEVVLSSEELGVTSLDPADQTEFFATDDLPESSVGESEFREVRLGNEPYLLLMAALASPEELSLQAGLLQPLSESQAAIKDVIVRVAVLGVILAGLALVLARFHLRTVFAPLQTLKQVAETMAAGHIDNPVDVKGASDIEALAVSFEHMRARLQSSLEKQRRWNEELDAQVRARTSELEKLCQTRDRLLGLLISAQEDERRRVARELHDETSQALANMIVTLGAFGRLSSDSEVNQQLQTTKGLAVEILEGVNRIVLDLRPRLLDDYGLIPALRWYAQDCLEKMGVDVEFEVRGAERRLAPLLETAVFRIIQEAVNNIVRHANATETLIRLEWMPSMLKVVVEDDGRGFDVEKITSGEDPENHFGILGMMERISLMGGKIAMESLPGRGTRVLFEVPVQEVVEPDVED
ncbi:MAG: ATP-binding protein [Anaerolineales bacterium]